MSLKINIGAGLKRIPDHLNIDSDSLCNPDYVVNLDTPDVHLPFEDNTVEYVTAHHILEHINHIFPLMKELYRVCEDGAIIDIVVPHHTHDAFHNDLTHVRPITVGGMTQLGKAHCLEHQKLYGSSSGHAVTLGVDFEMIWFDFEYDSFYAAMIQDYKKRNSEGTLSKEEDFFLQRLTREGNNVAIHTLMKMRVNK